MYWEAGREARAGISDVIIPNLSVFYAARAAGDETLYSFDLG